MSDVSILPPIETVEPPLSDQDLIDLAELGNGDVLRCRLIVVHRRSGVDVEDEPCGRPAVWMMRLSCGDGEPFCTEHRALVESICPSGVMTCDTHVSKVTIAWLPI